MKSRTTIFAVFLVTGVCIGSARAQVRGGVIGRYSMVEQTDTSLSHGPLNDAVTFGRTWIVGGVVDFQLTEHSRMAFEIAYGPYSNDVDRWCVYSFYAPSCPPFSTRVVSHVFLYEMQYRRNFGRGSWRPFVGGGGGVRQYQAPGSNGSETSYFGSELSVGIGAESTRGLPVRLEVRTLFVDGHPFQPESYRIEVHAGMTVLLLGRARPHP